jgi:hypothetical protein
MGRSRGGELWLATGGNHLGPTDLPFDPAGPGFDHGKPHIRFQHLFAAAALRDDLLGIFDPDCRSTRLMPRFGEKRKRSDTGVVLSMNEQGMVVYWSSPKEEFAAEFGLAVVKVVSALAAMRAC